MEGKKGARGDLLGQAENLSNGWVCFLNDSRELRCADISKPKSLQISRAAGSNIGNDR